MFVPFHSVALVTTVSINFKAGFYCFIRVFPQGLEFLGLVHAFSNASNGSINLCVLDITDALAVGLCASFKTVSQQPQAKG
jgi:hypothetical protein